MAHAEVTAEAEVMQAALGRADALAAGDRDRLLSLLHPDFRWTSHTGRRFDRTAYVDANTSDGEAAWTGQELADVSIGVVGQVAVLQCLVVDLVDHGGGAEEFRMPMTQVWVRSEHGWVLLAGHAGPRL